MLRKLIGFLLVVLFIFSVSALSFAQTPPAGQEISGQERTREIQEKEKELKERIEKPKETPQIEEKIPEEAVTPAPSQKTIIKKINVTGVTLLLEKQIKDIITPYENKELSVKEMQKVADLITDVYRQKGYITSRAYLPPQRIENNILDITVIEGKMGNIQVKGNRYFKTKLIASKITLEKGKPFNYNTLRRNLSKINEQPDRTARAVVTPGQEPGATDVILEVKDRLPIHLGFDWDNFGSRYIERDRYSVKFSHNNLLGFDDKLTFQYQLAQASHYFLKGIRYLFPISEDTAIGALATFSRVKLGKELEDSDARGKSNIYGLFLNQSLINTENTDLTLNLGFDYKDITNYQNQSVSSHDRLRNAKVGLDIDLTDNFGRSIISDEVDVGIPNTMGGLGQKDINASRSGSGGKFVKNSINLLRLQKMPFSSTLLWKNQIQTSPYILTSAEQFQLGGIANVRGYPPAEVVGDSGYAMTWEWTFPPYFLPRNIKVPLSKAKLYDALRFAGFYDWGNTRLRRPIGTEEKNKTLRSAGCGIRLNLPEDFSIRVDLAWPLDNTPSDSDHLHAWASASKTF